MAEVKVSNKEEWRPIAGYERRYEVSSLGRVRSLDRVSVSKNGVRRNLRGQTLKPQPHPGGYSMVSLGAGSGNSHLIHRLVAIAFVGKPPMEDAEVNHINGVKTDNRAINLEWTTRAGNMRHATRSGLVAAGERARHSKLSEEEVWHIIRLCDTGALQSEIAERFGVTQSRVSAIALGNSWKHLERGRRQRRRGAKRGERNKNAKLNASDVLVIREIHEAGESSRASLAQRFDVSLSTIDRVINRKSWKHL